MWFENEEVTDTTSRKSDKEVKRGKGLKILTPNKLWTRITISLAQLKTGNSSYSFKNEIRQIQYLLYQHNIITKKSL